jgi:hypothetical protein
MKFKVSYYDYDSDQYVTKDCDRMDFSNGEFYFSPVQIILLRFIRVLGIDDRKVSIHQNNDRIKIHITGYQYIMGEGGYERTETIIENVKGRFYMNKKLELMVELMRCNGTILAKLDRRKNCGNYGRDGSVVTGLATD